MAIYPAYMNILGILLFSVVFILLGWVYYFFLNITIAMWSPGKAGKKWTDIVSSPIIQEAYGVFRWLVPAWLFIMTVAFLIIIFNFLLDMM